MFDQILLAQKRLKGFANLTPVMSSSTLDKLLGQQVYFKCENFQKVGAFKFRGAFNSISSLTAAEKKRGVITYSSGNHAQAVSNVGRILGVDIVVVMPENAPKIKLAATAEYGASIVTYDPEVQSREKVTEALVEERGYTLIPPYNHNEVIAGQGTVALEFFEQVKDMRSLLVPCGGGGLLSGSAIVAKTQSQSCRVIGIEPELADDATRSFYSRTLHTVHNPQTIADGTRTPSLGSLTFPLILEHVDEMNTVSEDDIFTAVQFLFYRMKLVVEPSGALGLAAILSGKVRTQGPVGIIISGGNIDARTLNTILEGTSWRHLLKAHLKGTA